MCGMTMAWILLDDDYMDDIFLIELGLALASHPSFYYSTDNLHSSEHFFPR